MKKIVLILSCLLFSFSAFSFSKTMSKQEILAFKESCKDDQCDAIVQEIEIPGLSFCIYEGHYYMDNGNWPCNQPEARRLEATLDNAATIALGLYQTGFIELQGCEPKTCETVDGEPGTCVDGDVGVFAIPVPELGYVYSLFLKDCTCIRTF